MSTHPIPRRGFGATGEELSIVGFGGVIVTNMYPKNASRYVAEAFDAGVNYFDVAPFYGNAQEKLGPALAPYRDQSFLACKTKERSAAGAQRELDESLRLMQTDHFDLYQLHSLQSVEDDVDAAFAPDGAMETILRARDAGKIRYIGFSAHTEEAAHAAMSQFDFDSILFPVNYYAWTGENFGPDVVDAARKKGMAVLALKSLAHRRWTKEEFKSFFRPWPKCWYKPLDTEEEIEAAMTFTLSRSVDALIPPGHWDLFKQCVDLASRADQNASTFTDTDFALHELSPDDQPLFAAT